MPRKVYALEPKGPKRLEVSWKGYWKQFTILLDGAPVGEVPDLKALKEGQEFTLPDSSTLRVQFVQKLSGGELRILRNGRPLPGTASDPTVQLKSACAVIFFIAALNISLGVASLFFDSQFLSTLGGGVGSLIYGFLFLGLGFMVWKRSMAALIVAIALYLLDSILSVVLAFQANLSPGLAGLIVRFFFTIMMVGGLRAIKDLRQEESQEALPWEGSGGPPVP